MRAIALSLAAQHRRGPRRAPAPRRAALRWQRELARVAVIYLLYDGIRLLPNVALAAANRNGRQILDLEDTLHLDPERALNVWLHALPTAVPVAASFFYESFHYLVTPLVLIWLFRTAKDHYAQARTWLAAMTLSALLVFWLFPVTPPRMLPGSQMFDIVALEHGYGWWSGQGTAPHGLGSFVDEYAAMPSLHVGWALWCGVALFRHARHRAVRLAGLAYPVLTTVVVVATGNHYLLDAVAGVVVAGLGWLVARGWTRMRVRGADVTPMELVADQGSGSSASTATESAPALPVARPRARRGRALAALTALTALTGPSEPRGGVTVPAAHPPRHDPPVSSRATRAAPDSDAVRCCVRVRTPASSHRRRPARPPG